MIDYVFLMAYLVYSIQWVIHLHICPQYVLHYIPMIAGEYIKKATFFHNGRRVVALEKKPDAPISDRIQQLRPTPTLKGFG